VALASLSRFLEGRLSVMERIEMLTNFKDLEHRNPNTKASD